MVAVLKSSSESSELKWVKVSDWLWQTECGNYRCRKLNVNELTDDKGNLIFAAPTLRYQLYGPDGMRIGPRCESFRAARALIVGAKP